MKKQSRGGAINYQKGNTDIEHLTDVLSKYVKENGPFNVFDFGEYNSLGANHAIRGVALAKIGQFVLCLLKARPDACMTYSDLKSAIVNVCLRFPEAVTHKHKDLQSHAADIADRCMVILKHSRSLVLGENADTIWKRCTANVPHYLMSVLCEIRDSIVNSDAKTSHGDGVNTKPTRSLAPHDSSVSVDDMGLPTLNFAQAPHHSHAPAVASDPLSLQAEQLGIVPPTKFLLKESMGIAKKPAAAKVKPVAKKSKPSTKVITKQKASTSTCTVDQVIDKASLKLQGPFKDQSYITHMKPAKLVVACTAKQCANHFQVLEKVLMHIKNTPHCSKKAAVAQRDKVLSGKLKVE